MSCNKISMAIQVPIYVCDQKFYITAIFLPWKFGIALHSLYRKFVSVEIINLIIALQYIILTAILKLHLFLSSLH